MSHSSMFPTTQWTGVRHAGLSAAALAQLLPRYLRPLRTYLVLQRKFSPDKADDLLQGFLAEKVLERNLVEHADRERGRFRTFLLVALNRYVSNQLRNERSARHPSQGVSDMIAETAQDDMPGPAEAFEVAWAKQVLADAAARMMGECRSAGREDVWGVFEGRVLSPTLEGAQPVSYEDLTRQYQLDGVEATRNLLVTGKRMFARSIRGVVREYIGDESLVEQEITELRQLLAAARK